jgi:RHH-type transcriptional regulator, proline utilization regulon repressor / proline dehydrogenase / delta 1-pyrroline-5-carboxylate dehydrogenase
MVDDVMERASVLATDLLKAALAAQSPPERADSARLARMMNDPAGKAFTVQMVDQVFRNRQPQRQAARFRTLLRKFGAPVYLSSGQRALMQLGAALSNVAPAPVMRAVASQLRRDTAQVILPAEPAPLQRYLAARRASRTGVIVNQLGEAVLGEREAAWRMDAILGLLKDPNVPAISVKLSSVHSQINLLDWEGTLASVCDRLRRLYRAALPAQKFVNLDMEEYRDLHLTLAAFERVLGEPDFHGLRAGVVLQAYLPDSWTALQRLTDWALARVASGGAPVKLRLVKGANLAMESVEAEWHGWPRAPYATKADTDANFCRMLDYACDPKRAQAMNVAVGSHNLFDIALGLLLRQDRGLGGLIEFEMLEGMAPHQARAVQQAAGGLVLYAPVVHSGNFNSALTYLLRRLDENTSAENFLRDLFDLAPESESWRRQCAYFTASWVNRAAAPVGPRRLKPLSLPPGRFANIPDTDWTHEPHRAALADALSRWRPDSPAAPGPGDVNAALDRLRSAQPAWASSGFENRGKLLRQCALAMEEGRFDTIACMVHDGKKAAAEADVEISEAIDFARYYAEFRPLANLRASALGIVAVTPPWNFPYAIPCGGVLAALMAGNTVVLKPAPETAATAWRLAQQLWQAGIPRDALCFLPCDEAAAGRSLITDSRVAAVVLTGACQTARLFLDWRPSLRLLAETSGKNSIIITAQADRDLAVKDLIKSAFNHAGQKCSAASLAILEAEVYDDPAFRAQLLDAAASLPIGAATEPSSVVTPLIRPPGEALRRALTSLDKGEEWLLAPRQAGADPCQWSPGIKLGVQRGSWFHRTECFGPVLGLMRAASLDEAMAIQNDSDFGLTAGLHSLDEEEIALWRERVATGNAYINRAITGAIVQRQPFGGWKGSSFGPGAKAGGPNYVAQFARFEDIDETVDTYDHWWKDYFSKPHDPSALRCETNTFRYRPCRGVVLRLDDGDKRSLELARRAAEVCGTRLHVSLSGQESEVELAARLPSLASEAEFLRTVKPPSDVLLRSAYAAGLNWIDAPLLSDGRYELTRWLREQSISETRHRYGLIMDAPSSALHSSGRLS